MHRRALLVGVSAALVPLAGCVAEPGTNGGLLEVLETTAPAGATVVPATDDRTRDVAPVQTALDRASASRTGTADLRVDPAEFDAAAEALADLPWYERADDHPSGIYLGHAGATYVASLWPYCADSILGSAESDRGVYGPGGCLDPADRPGTP